MSDRKFVAKWNIFKFNKFTLYGKKWKNGDKSPSLALNIYQNNPRFVVYLNNGSFDKGITLALDPIIFTEIMNTLIDVGSDPEMKPVGYTWELKNKYDHRRKYEQTTVVAAIHVGRDAEGVCFIAARPNNEEICKFEFGQAWFAPQKDGTGELTPPKVKSGTHARAWADTLKGVMTSYLSTHGEEPVRRDAQPSQNKSQSSGSFGGSTDFDSDVQF